MTHQDGAKEYPVIYLKSQGVFGIIVSYGAFVSMVHYYKDGISYEVYVENEDIEWVKN